MKTIFILFELLYVITMVDYFIHVSIAKANKRYFDYLDVRGMLGATWLFASNVTNIVLLLILIFIYLP
jgi:hypothetical protein